MHLDREHGRSGHGGPSAAALRFGPTGRWAAVLAVIGVALLVVVHLSRFPEWDEAVFLSQSGGFRGVDARAPTLVASREVGTPVVLGVLRSLGPSLATTRLLWMALAFAVLVVGVVQLGRRVGFPPSAAVLVLATYWLSFSFWSSFFSVFLATACMLLASGIYLALRASPDHVVARGAGLGLAFAACLWFRQVEGALFVAVVGLHGLVVGPRAFWPARWRGVLAAAATLVAGFAVPWSIDSIRRFGSVAERLAAGRGQSFERGLGSQVVDYLGTLVGQSQTYGDTTTMPTWAVVVLGVLLAGAVVATVVSVLRGPRADRSAASADGVEVGGLSLLWLVGVTQMAFFMFFIELVMDRYMVSGALFVLVAIIATTWPQVRRGLAAGPGEGGTSRRFGGMALAGVLALWVVANAAVAMRVEDVRFAAGAATQEHAETIRALAEGGPCHGVSRYNSPQLQFGSGCVVRSVPSPAAARRGLDEMPATEGLRFVLWPTRTADQVEGLLGPSSQSLLLETPTGRQGMVLRFTRP